MNWFSAQYQKRIIKQDFGTGFFPEYDAKFARFEPFNQYSLSMFDTSSWTEPVLQKPLTHHEILRLIGPFSLRGYHPDLELSNRLERKLLFKSITHPARTLDTPNVTEILQLEEGEHNTFRLTRKLAAVLANHERLEAELVAEGADNGALLDWIKMVPLETHFRFGSNFGIAKSYRVQPEFALSASMPLLSRLIMSRASAFVEGVLVTFSLPKLRVDLDCLIELQPPPGEVIKLSEDFLAVLGWNWGLLRRSSQGFKANLQISGKEPDRSRKAERKLDQMIDHLSITLAAPPAQFHDRLVGARWLVVLRRAIPLLVGLVLLGGAIATLNTDFAQNSPFRMWMFNGPPLLLIGIFCMREIPSIEIPPLPRRLREKSWRQQALEPASVRTTQFDRAAQGGFYFRR